MLQFHGYNISTLSTVHPIVKRIRPTYFTLAILLCASNSFADDYTVNVLPRQISFAQEVVEVDISGLKHGEKLEVGSSSGTVWVYRRTQKEIDFISNNYIGSSDENIKAIVSRIERGASSTSGYLHSRLQLVDQPELEKSPFRSKEREYFVFIPYGRLGCTLTENLPSNLNKENGAWLYDPCFNQVYDLTGQFLDQQGALYSLETGELIVSDREVFPRTEIPPHRYTAARTLEIGVSDIHSAPDVSLSEERLFSGLTPIDTLLKATSFNDIERARAAIKDGADVTTPGGGIPDPDVSLALLRAVFFSSSEMVELLLSHGAVAHENHIKEAKRRYRHDVTELLEAARTR